MSESPSDHSVEILCQNLDDLTLLQLDQLEEQLNLMSRLESNMMSGFINLAKSRYISGESSVSTTQLPGEESEVTPSIKVDRDSNNKLEIIRNENGSNALRWFGVLVPNSLRQSQTFFKNVLEIAVEVINVREEAEKSLKEYNHLVKTKQNVM